jgi:type II secretory pathway component PulM
VRIMKRLSKRDKKVLTGAGLLLVIYVVVFHGVLPLYDAGSEVQADLGQKQRMLQGAVRTIQQREVYGAQLAELEKVLSQYEQRLLDAADSTTGATQLDDIVRNLTNASQLTLTKSNPLQEKKIGDRFVKVTIQINLDGDLASTTAFLYSLSAHPKFLLVEDFSVSRFRLQQQLQPRMNVSAFIRLS